MPEPLTADYVLRQISIWNLPNVLRYEHFTLHYMRRKERLWMAELCPLVMTGVGLLARLPRDMRRAILLPMCARVTEIEGVGRQFMARRIVDVPELARFLDHFNQKANRLECKLDHMKNIDVSMALLFVSIILRQPYERMELIAPWEAQNAR